MYKSSSVTGLISEKLIIMSATLKTSIKYKLLSTTENLDIMNQVEATQNVPCKSLSTNFTRVSTLNMVILRHYSACTRTDKPKKDKNSKIWEVRVNTYRNGSSKTTSSTS